MELLQIFSKCAANTEGHQLKASRDLHSFVCLINESVSAPVKPKTAAARAQHSTQDSRIIVPARNFRRFRQQILLPIKCASRPAGNLRIGWL